MTQSDTHRAPRHIHLSGICGTAMASLAGLLQLRGYRITGSDKAAYPPMSDLLRSLGIPVMEPYAESNLSPAPDLVVIGNALSRGNPEVERVLDERIPFTSMAALLREEFLLGRESLVVAGTHGKTTTTSMLAWIYQVAARQNPSLEPSFLIGGVAENFGSSFQLRPTRTFIVEGDEYDTAFFDKGPKFLHYFPDALILTHVEFDHADIYADLDAVKTAFKRLVNLVPRRGLIVAYDGSENVTECVSQRLLPRRALRISATAADWRIRNLRHENGRTRWEVCRAGAAWAEFEMHLAGEHNALNATAAAALAAGQGIAKEAIAEALATFKSVKRRLEVRAEIGGITLIEDFAHHPTAIRETLRALRSVYPQARLWAVLEPRSNTLRRKVLAADLVESLRLADRVVLAAVYQQQRIPEAERLHPEEVVRALNAAGTPGRAAARCRRYRRRHRAAARLRRRRRHPLQWRLRRHLRETSRAAARALSRRNGATARGTHDLVSHLHRQHGSHWAFPRRFSSFPGAGSRATCCRSTKPRASCSPPVAAWPECASASKVSTASPADRACIFMSNHVSNLDPPALISLIPGRTSAFMKRSLMKLPILGTGFRQGEFIAVDRTGNPPTRSAAWPKPSACSPRASTSPLLLKAPARPTAACCPSRKARSFSPWPPARRAFRSPSMARRRSCAKAACASIPAVAHVVFHRPSTPPASPRARNSCRRFARPSPPVCRSGCARKRPHRKCDTTMAHFKTALIELS